MGDDKVTHTSGSQSSHFSEFSFYNPFEGAKLTCQRFKEGNRKYEDSDTVYANMNWLKAFHAKDINFFRDRSGHALEHLIAEMHGDEDEKPGGNLGAVGWWVEIMAYVRKHDPVFYKAIQGVAIADEGSMLNCDRPNCPLCTPSPSPSNHFIGVS